MGQYYFQFQDKCFSRRVLIQTSRAVKHLCHGQRIFSQQGSIFIVNNFFSYSEIIPSVSSVHAVNVPGDLSRRLALLLCESRVNTYAFNSNWNNFRFKTNSPTFSSESYFDDTTHIPLSNFYQQSRLFDIIIGKAGRACSACSVVNIMMFSYNTA